MTLVIESRDFIHTKDFILLEQIDSCGFTILAYAIAK